MDLEIRPLGESELPALNARMPNKPHVERLIRQSAGEAVYLVAWKDGTPAGHLLFLRPHAERSEMATREKCAEIIDLFVHEDVRRLGVARALMRNAEQLARGERIGRIGLGVQTDNTAARNLYESLGFLDSGRGPYIESGERRDDSGKRRMWVLIENYLTKVI